MVLPIRADNLEAERKAVFPKSRGQRHGGHAKESPRRTIFRLAREAQAFRRFAKSWQGQYGVEGGNLRGEADRSFS
jgi:hypothetical protein